MKADWVKYPLKFKVPAQTSRDTLTHKDSWFIIIEEGNNFGIGEAGIIPGLSIDDPNTIEQVLEDCCNHISEIKIENYKRYPSVQFAIETALMSLASKDPFVLFANDFMKGGSSIEINGLVWMGDADYMKDQIIEKINNGFDCIKLKIGSLDFEQELSILKFIRKEFSEKDIQIRLDANGAFDVNSVLDKLNRLSQFHIHSVEQPIGAGQLDRMQSICNDSPIAIALDEELIGISSDEIDSLLSFIKPQYIVLKPSLIGGLIKTERFINAASNLNIDWWVTSALESNIGLNAISQWVYNFDVALPQGLGTGQLYENNPQSPLYLFKNQLKYSQEKKWDINKIYAWEAIS